MTDDDLPWESLRWRHLRKTCGIRNEEKWFDSGVSWKVGSGDKISFWKDEWMEGQSLEVLFPRLYILSEQKEHLIGHMGIWREETWHWDLKWQRVLFEWENQLIIQLNGFLANVQVCREDMDLWLGRDALRGFCLETSFEDGFWFILHI